MPIKQILYMYEILTDMSYENTHTHVHTHKTDNIVAGWTECVAVLSKYRAQFTFCSFCHASSW